MSTKVLNAFRVKSSAMPWELLWQIQASAVENVRRLLREHYVHLVRHMSADDPGYQKERARWPADTAEHIVRLTVARERVLDCYRKQLPSIYRDTYTLDVSVALYPFKGRYYLRAFCEPISVVAGALDFLHELPELEDYHYQNSCDRPDAVSARDWARRRRVWFEIFPPSAEPGACRCVTVDVINKDTLPWIDPWRELLREWRAAPPDLPSAEQVWVEKLQQLPSLRDDAITCSPGLIRGTNFVISKTGDTWSWQLGARAPRSARSLDMAAERVWFEFQPEDIKAMATSMMRDACESRKWGKKK